MIINILDSAVVAACDLLKALAYPTDQARGFAVGDMRGAFTLTKPPDGRHAWVN